MVELQKEPVPKQTITNVDRFDLASCRCVVTNAYGNATSSAATLTLTSTCPNVRLLNGSFEGGNTGGVATARSYCIFCLPKPLSSR